MCWPCHARYDAKEGGHPFKVARRNATRARNIAKRKAEQVEHEPYVPIAVMKRRVRLAFNYAERQFIARTVWLTKQETPLARAQRISREVQAGQRSKDSSFRIPSYVKRSRK